MARQIICRAIFMSNECQTRKKTNYTKINAKKINTFVFDKQSYK